PRNCDVSQWSSWGDCSSHCGGGTQIRTRRITTPASCGGGCPSYSFQDIRRCNTQCCPVDCAFGWSQWSPCVGSDNGRCGAGTQTRTRQITRQPYCSSPCPALSGKRSCTHSCCPVSCQVSGWGAWGACSTTCGTGWYRATHY
ncbi:predicted protein, partial [Nematostella vectensis]